MKKIISLLLTVVMLVGCVATLASCGAPKDGGPQINVYLGNSVYDFDPTDYYADSNAEQLMNLLYEPLFRVNAKGKLELAAAKKYKIDEAERTIVIELRESYWSDEIRVKAQDFVYAWCERILNPNNPNAAAPLFYDIEHAADVKSGKGTVSDIEAKATGVYEITIKYRKGADPERLLKNLASVAASPVRQDVVATAPTYWSKSTNSMVFNGPFKVRLYDADTGSFTVERNRGFHQDPLEENYTKYVKPEMLIGLTTPAGDEISVSYADLEKKTVFFMGDASLADRQANKNNAIVADDTSVYSYIFNTENPLFKDARVRKALSVVIDRQAIADAITFGKAANGFLPDICGGSTDELIGGANKALAEELLKDVDFTGLKKAFTLTIDNNEKSAKIAEIAVEAWKSIGFNVKVVKADTVKNVIQEIEIEDNGVQVLLKDASYGNRNFDVLAVDWQLYSQDAFVGLAGFSSSLNGGGQDFNTGLNRKNVTGWSNAEYDFLISTALKTQGEERTKALKEAEQMLIDESPIIPLVFNQNFMFVHDDLTKVEVDAYGNFSFTNAKQKDYRQYLPEKVDEE